MTFKTEKLIRTLRQERSDFRDKGLIAHGRMLEIMEQTELAREHNMDLARKVRDQRSGDTADFGPLPKRLGSCIKDYFESDFNAKGRRLGKT